MYNAIAAFYDLTLAMDFDDFFHFPRFPFILDPSGSAQIVILKCALCRTFKFQVMRQKMKKINLESMVRDVAFEFGESLWRYFHMRERRFRTS